jgi:hypothetical protein
MRLPVGLIEAMDHVLRDEARARRRAEARAKAHRGR